MILGLSLLFNFAFSNENNDDKKEQEVATACCTEKGSVGTPGTPGYMSVIVVKCEEANVYSDAKVAACANAAAAVKKSLELADAAVTISPTN